MTNGWIDPKESLPEPFESVQVYIPTQYPFPRVREGFIVPKGDTPFAWYVPGLREKFPMEEFIVAWKPFSKPPRGT